MTLATLRTQVTALLETDLNNFQSLANGTLANSDLNSQINWALRLLAKKLFLYDPSIALTTVNNQQTYDLRSLTPTTKAVIWSHYVIINGVALADAQGTEPGMFTAEEFQRRIPLWRTAANGTPTAAMQSDRTLYLSPKPNAVIASSYVAGTYLPAALSSDGDIPDIPVELHEILASLAAVKASEPSCSDQEGWARLQRYDASMVEYIDQEFIRCYQLVFGDMKGAERFRK